MNTRMKTKWRPKLETLEARRLMSVYADFNGDGFDDLAVGSPGENNASGMVQVLYGSANGLVSTGNQLWTQGSLGTEASESGDGFGSSLASGDFNNDGFADLAVGVPGEDVGSIVGAGAVHFILGSANGLTGIGDYLMHQDVSLVPDACETGDAFGSSLAAGYFNNDAFADLAVGVPGQNLFVKVDAGAVHVFYGSTLAIAAAGSRTMNLDTSAMAGFATAGDNLGSSLSSGDYNNDGFDDVAVGAPSYDTSGNPNSGGILIVDGSATGLTPTGSQFAVLADIDAMHGIAVASGDFDGDGFDDVVSGAPFDNVGTSAGAGELLTYKGSAAGVAFWQQLQQGGLGDASEANDNFGASLVATDFNGDGRFDLAIGAPGESSASVANAGQVTIVFGSTSGFTASGAVQVEPVDVGHTQDVDDFFGETLAAGDYNGNGSFDIVIGVPRDNVGTVVDAGSVIVLYAIVGPEPQTWNQNTPGIADSSEAGDRFGGGLDSNAGRDSAFRNSAHLITADVDFETSINKLNKRRPLGGRR